MNNDIQLITEKILSTKDYIGLDEILVENAVQKELIKGKKPKDAEKSVKVFLHRVYGAFTGSTNYEKLFSNLEKAYRTGNEEKMRGG